MLKNTCNSVANKPNKPVPKPKSTKKSKSLCKERLDYNMDLQQIDESNKTSDLGKPESLKMRMNVSWTEREQKAWLHTYSNFMDKKQLTKEGCKWKQFSRILKEEFGVDKDNVQCSKQVILISFIM